MYDQETSYWYLGRKATPIPGSEWQAIRPDTTQEPYSDFVISTKPN